MQVVKQIKHSEIDKAENEMQLLSVLSTSCREGLTLTRKIAAVTPRIKKHNRKTPVNYLFNACTFRGATRSPTQ